MSIRLYENSIIKSDLLFPDNTIIMDDYGKLNDSIFSFRVFTKLNDERISLKTRTSFLNSTINRNIPIYSNSHIIFMNKDMDENPKFGLFKEIAALYCIIEYNIELSGVIDIYYLNKNQISELISNKETEKQLLIYEFIFK